MATRTKAFTEEEFCGYTVHMAYAACWKFWKCLEKSGDVTPDLTVNARGMLQEMAALAFAKYPTPTPTPQLIECWQDMGIR